MRIEDKYSVFARRGSFGWELLDESSQSLAEDLCRLSRTSSAQPRILESTRWCSGKNDLISYNEEIKFSTEDILTLGVDLQKRIIDTYKDQIDNYVGISVIRVDEHHLQDDGYGYLDIEDDLTSDIIHIEQEDCSYLIAPSQDISVSFQINPEDLFPQYVIPIPFNIRPLTILGENDTILQSGIGFKIGNGSLTFLTNPYDIFPTNTIHVLEAHTTRQPLYDYVFGIDGLQSSGKHVIHYYRINQSGEALENALREIAGLSQVPPKAGRLENIQTDCAGYVYTFEKGSVNINYKHEPLEIGQAYDSEEWIGTELVQVYSAAGWHTPEWYRQLSWENGMSLDSLIPFKGIILPDYNSKVWVQAVSTSGLHVRIDLEGNQDSVDKYWNHVLNTELETGRLLNDAIGFTDALDTTYLNPIDFFFNNLLSYKGVIVVIDEQNLSSSAITRIRKFIQQDRPLGSSVIVRNR